jgi:hypothetical protein
MRGIEQTAFGFHGLMSHKQRGSKRLKAPTAKARPKEECAYCHIENGAKKDEVWTRFYRLLDTAGMRNIE